MHPSLLNRNTSVYSTRNYVAERVLSCAQGRNQSSASTSGRNMGVYVATMSGSQGSARGSIREFQPHIKHSSGESRSESATTVRQSRQVEVVYPDKPDNQVPRQLQQLMKKDMPIFILNLMDPDIVPEFPAKGAMMIGPSQNMSLDKVILTLGRHHATWKRALLLFDWLVENNHKIDERLCASVIRICSNKGRPRKAIDIYEWMRRRPEQGGAGLSCSVFTYTSVMKAALLDGDIDYALVVWNHARSSIPEKMDSHIITVLIEALDRKGDIDSALEMYYSVQSNTHEEFSAEASIQTYNAAMKAAIHGARYDDAINIWKDMRTRGVKPSVHAYATIIHAHGSAGDWKEAIKKFDQMVNNGIAPDVIACTALVDALASNGCCMRAEKVVEWMKTKGVHPNVRTYTVLLNGLSKSRREVDRALQLFDRMYTGSLGPRNRPNEYTYSLLLKNLADGGLWREAESIFFMLEKDVMEYKHAKVGEDQKRRKRRLVDFNEVICGSMMYAYERAGRWQEALEFFKICKSLGFRDNAIIQNTLISALAKSGQMKTAEDVFDTLSSPDHVAFETMVAGYGLVGNTQAAELLLQRMQNAGYHPTDYAYCGLIAGYSIQGSFQKSLDVYTRSKSAGVEPSVHLFNAMIASCDRFHKYERAILLLEEMKLLKVKGNAMTHNLTMSVCTEGVRSVENQQAAITAISAAVAAAGSIMIRAGVF
jgi:pentatricopeptide repeat protein